MSIESIALALHHSNAKGTAKLVLIGIANHDGDGGAWPTIDTLAKYSGVSRQNVQKALASLERLGEIRRVIQAGGDHNIADHRRPNRYEVLLSCPPTCDGTKHHRTRTELVFHDVIHTGLGSEARLGSEAGGGLGSEAQTVLVNSSTKTQEKALDPAARATLLRGTCVPPFKRHEYVGGICVHGCGCYADGRVEDPKTGRVLLEADEVRA